MPEAQITFGISKQEVAMLAAAIAAEMEKHFTVEPTLTLAEAAKSIGLSVTVMRQLCREKKLPAIKLDKSYRIRVVDINRYLDERSIPADCAPEKKS